MTLFPELKDDFTAENGVTYTWEENRWRTKSFLTADGSVVEVGPTPPVDPSEGGLWYDSTRLELFVFYTDPDGVGGWVPCSPLGARVEAGEIVQAQLVERVGELEKRDPELYVKKTGATMTGPLSCTRPGESAPGSYILSVKAEGLETNKQVAFRVTADGAVKAGHDTGHAFMASASNDVVTKGYLDSKGVGFNPCIFTCTTTQNIGELQPGYFFINDSGSIVLHHAMADGTLWCIKREGSNFVQEFAAIVTISELGGRTMYQGNMKKLTTYGTPNNAIHCTLEVSEWRQKTCLNGVQYMITIPGILPRFIQS